MIVVQWTPIVPEALDFVRLGLTFAAHLMACWDWLTRA
jgi:hypothetical protein